MLIVSKTWAQTITSPKQETKSYYSALPSSYRCEVGGQRGMELARPHSDDDEAQPILSYPILSYPILSYPILSYPILYYTILYYLPSKPLFCPLRDLIFLEVRVPWYQRTMIYGNKKGYMPFLFISRLYTLHIYSRLSIAYYGLTMSY